MALTINLATIYSYRCGLQSTPTGVWHAPRLWMSSSISFASPSPIGLIWPEQTPDAATQPSSSFFREKQVSVAKQSDPSRKSGGERAKSQIQFGLQRNQINRQELVNQPFLLHAPTVPLLPSVRLFILQRVAQSHVTLRCHYGAVSSSSCL